MTEKKKTLNLSRQTVKHLSVRTDVRTGWVYSVDACPKPEPSPFSRPTAQK